MELGCGYFVEMEWWIFPNKYSMQKSPHIFFVLRLVILPQPGLGRIAEQVKY